MSLDRRTPEANTPAPIWAAALLAACHGGTDEALCHRIEWNGGRASLRFTNAGHDPVVIPGLDVQLGVGSTLDVRWPAGATAYELRTNNIPRKRPCRRHIQVRHHQAA